MEIKDQHKKLLKSLGLKEEDFERFDGTSVSYEFDSVKGVRLYDPDYETSYDEYIDVDGWSAWSSEQNTFMEDILKPTWEEVERREKMERKSSQEEFEHSLEKKFGKKPDSNT
jgi:hypothetical protein